MNKYLKFTVKAGGFFWAMIFLFFLFMGMGFMEGPSRTGITPDRLFRMLMFFLSMAYVFYCIFISGFIVVGKRYDNACLKNSSLLVIASTLIPVVFMGIAYYFEPKGILPDLLGRLFFVALILFGIGLLKLKPQYGRLAVWSGVMELIPAVMLTIFPILSGIYLYLFIPQFMLKRKILLRAVNET